jgi:hypothetical protein
MRDRLAFEAPNRVMQYELSLEEESRELDFNVKTIHESRIGIEARLDKKSIEECSHTDLEYLVEWDGMFFSFSRLPHYYFTTSTLYTPIFPPSSV